MPGQTIRNQTCPTAQCTSRIVSHGQKYSRFKCQECGRTWVSSRKGPYYGLKHDLEKVEAVFKLSRQGFSIRKISNITKVSPGTIQRWKLKFKDLFIS
ncbi:MAG: hypothetical protein AAB592_05550 [Patescibacteria group bacterium]